MIVPMMKYSMALFYKDYHPFLEQLQELGLVDVTVSAWKASEEEQGLIDKIKDYKLAAKQLKQIATSANKSARKNISVEDALEMYKTASAKLSKLKAEYEKNGKEVAELAAWGEFDVSYIEKLKAAKIDLHFYVLNTKRFEDFQTLWQDKYSINKINVVEDNVYFVIANAASEEFEIDLPELNAPTVTYSQATQSIADIKTEIDEQQYIVNQSVAYVDDFLAESVRLSDQLHLSKVVNSGEEAVEGKLIILEGWATVDTQKEVENLLDNSGALYIKENPTPEDNTPVKLKNNRFARLFEFVGELYTLPQYGTTDMTPYCTPFYVLFFGFCLGDGAYGIIFILMGLFLALKMKNVIISRLGWLAFWCGLSTLMFGLLTNSFFGAEILSKKLLKSDLLFYLALGVGMIHILAGMTVRVYSKTKYFGYKYALSTIGWMTVIISTIMYKMLPEIGVHFFGTIPWAILFCFGIFLMFFCNTPGKSPFVNFGTGLWNTYNDVTGILGDFLSYLRLFALGLSGGVLAMVFNSLAFGMSPDTPILRELVIVLILFMGHALNLCMNAIGAFVHPMRLTFVEFYKNAGFEPGQRVFTPLKKEK